MDHLRRLASSVSQISVPVDKNGFTGRECPQQGCKGYFKIEVGTGLKEKGLPCHCPYCGYTAGHDQFWTKEQIEYLRSVARQKVTDAIYKDLKKMEFDHKPRGAFDIGFSMKVGRPRSTPIRYYREKQLETEIVCPDCTLRYSVYGVFAFCPDCGQRNSLQILEKNLDMIGKMLDLAAEVEKPIAEKLIENALEDCVSAFDGFGRELCYIHRERASNPNRAEKISFQDLESANVNVKKFFGLDIPACLTVEEWQAVVVAFQKRHLVAHKLGVVDQGYLNKTGDTCAVIGRKIAIKTDDVNEAVEIIRAFAPCISTIFQKLWKEL